MTDTLITEEMLSRVGSTLRTARSFPIAASDIRKWAIAAYYPEVPPRLFWDEQFAKSTAHGGIVAPEDFNPFAWMMADPPPDPSKTLEVKPKRSHDAAGTTWRANVVVEMEFAYTGVRMRPGDTISLTTFLKGYFEREGRMGLMLYTTTGERWTNQNDEVVRESEMVLVRYR